MSFRHPAPLLPAAFALLAASAILSASLFAAPIVRWIPDPADPARMIVEAAGLDPAAVENLKSSEPSAAHRWSLVLAVYADPDGALGDSSLPPMLGAYRIQPGGLRFEPQFPLVNGVSYRAVFHPGELDGAEEIREMTATHKVPAAKPRPGTVVSQVYPSASTLPENLLRLYVHFSAPMSRGHIYEYIHLFDEDGRAVELPFLELDEELWNPAMTRLTLLIDPGRIKRGLLPRDESGAALEAGKNFRFVIDPNWKDASGNPLTHGFEKKFLVGPAEREPLDTESWEIEPPAAGTRAPLVIRFPKPLDHAITQRVIRVNDPGGAALEGAVELKDEERRWSFIPAAPWIRGRLQIVVPNTMEDLAGNNIGKSFDVDLETPGSPAPANAISRLFFEVR